MTPTTTCAAPHCHNTITRRPGQKGRPPIYCSPTCRPSHTRPTLTIEIGPDDTDDPRPPRQWTIRLRRGQHAVILGQHLGRFAAAALAAELRAILPADIKDNTT